MNIFARAAQLEEKNVPFALASIIETRGSAPRHSGQMIVKTDGTIIGTVGGGMIERYVIEQSLEAMSERKARVVKGRMTQSGPEAMGMDCGGSMSVFIDVYGLRPSLLLIGGGHVNRAVAHAAHVLGFDITVADAYEDSLAEEHFPEGTKCILGKSMEDAIDKLNITEESFVVIATNHQDKDAISKIVNRDTRYTGLMASRRKVQTLFNHLRTCNVSEEHIQAIHSPIGFNIGAETPDEIAISIMAEILKVKHQSAGGLMKDDPRINRNRLVLIRGAGDIATGVAIRLKNSGFKVVMTDISQPTVIRCSVSFAQCLYGEPSTVEGVTARKANNCKDVYKIIDDNEIAVMVDEECCSIDKLKPTFLVDAILAKRNLGTRRDMAPVTIALGPGFTAGEDCDAVIETNRGHYLGRIIYNGVTQANTGIPGNIAGYTHQRVMRASSDGVMHNHVKLGDIVEEGDVVAHVGDNPVIAPLSGMVRGLLNEGLTVTEGFKIGDIDPRGIEADYTTVSDKARAIGGSVLEAMLHLEHTELS
ncbi:EF2563 family selenium-dependent molybdenum hydroxylase system protein [Vibrio sp. DW001]|uniref:selenium-dependent molybdenum cofactor biosynthesis protein YqeB n=1 Tax=Vibrio sp. DW001 TaxID=2912315 RepID=UPI0023AED120|nr:selenium-dependent molybdenum cofactor biosynthesis protein YqeB [Vibrio sp. DW001]WED29615.1 EF2563 family selenium-dependent molybdenum hydroxylase system protein [Vibrio sp. DW001]